jgi:aspartyl-tRNA(Asn)/glutamyl-tRNA(Gln) amidotransferase subunit A
MRRIAKCEPTLGAVVEQVAYRDPDDGPLRGMVLGIKVHQDVAGYRNWLSLQAHGMDGEPATQDSTVVARLLRSGATLACTTSAPFIGAPGGVTPQTRNSRSPDRVSGGSSGGSSSALAAGLVHGALGSDSGGSIRIPAACCGVVGLQTTRGVVPLTRAGGLTYSMGNVGPLASTVEDVRLILDAIAGFDSEDPYSVASAPRDGWDGRLLKIGLPSELVDDHMDPEVRQVFDGVMDRLRAEGHRVDAVSIPMLRESMDLGPRTIGIVESGSIIEDNLLDALGDIPELVEAVERSKQISGPTMARTYHRVEVFRSAVQRTFAEYDVLMTPTLPCRVPDGSAAHLEADIEVGGAVETRTSALTRLVNPWNLAAVPAGSQPVGRDSDDAPVSMQIIGPQFSEWKLLDIMQHLEGLLGGPWDTVDPMADHASS